ncbi:MAG TPA: ATP-binding protein, partial [Allocoleopsis sp.]
ELQHLESGGITPVWGEINLLQWLPAIVLSYQEQAVARTLTLRLQVPKSLPSLVSNEEKLTSVMRELLANACKYTPPGGVITVEVTQLEERLHLSVSNTGKVIPPDALSHLFDKFYRIPGGDRWKQGGTGLGLTLVKQQVEVLGGGIQVSSDAERTVFTVELPIRPPALSQ